MGVYTFTLDDKVVSELKQWVISKHGKLHKKLSKTVEQAIKEFLERKKQEFVVAENANIALVSVPKTVKVYKKDNKDIDEDFERVKEKISFEKGPEEGAPQKSGEKYSKTEELFFSIADKDPMRALNLIFGPGNVPSRILFGAFVKLLVKKGFSEQAAVEFARKLIDKGVYMQNASLLILSRREEL